MPHAGRGGTIAGPQARVAGAREPAASANARAAVPGRRGEHSTARSSFRRRAFAFTIVELPLLAALIAPVAIAQSATSQLVVSAGVVALGDVVTVSGTVSGALGCTAGRPVTLEWRPAGVSVFASVDGGITAADGSFAFEQQQPHTGSYRAMLPQQGTCGASTTNEAVVRVRALVQGTLDPSSIRAGGCTNVSASVEPPRPGQSVRLERRTRDGWILVESLTLDASSHAAATPCFSRLDVGTVRLRVRWPAQDVLNETASAALLLDVEPMPWMEAIEDAIGDRRVSVAVGEDDTYLYGHAERRARIPASNEKLLLAMAMLDTLGPSFRIRTSAATTAITDGGAVRDLWILGRGDPTVDVGTLGRLARELVEAGVRRVRGRVMGSLGYFRRDWDAPGWSDEAREYAGRPTALVFDRNRERHPERRAAAALTVKLERLGIRVAGPPGAGRPPDRLETLAFVTSPPLRFLLTKTLRPSDNFMAETLGKRLGAEARGVPGTIAKAAATIQAWAAGRGASFALNDSSGLSYANRVTTEGIVRLLWAAEDASWGADLRRALPAGGQGTLVHRLHGVAVRAKTGTLDRVSALSGWVRSRATGTWVEFSILSAGMSKTAASAIEDRIVLILERRLG